MSTFSGKELGKRRYKADTDELVGTAPQLDDITMLCLDFKERMKRCEERTVEAAIENVGTIIKFVDEQLEAIDCPVKLQAEIDIVVDEIFSNIAFYAYSPDTGSVTVRVEVEDSTVSLIFSDSGVPYDPLAKEDPDTDLELEDRAIGGLGIYMVKQIASSVHYEYVDEHNVLTVVFAR